MEGGSLRKNSLLGMLEMEWDEDTWEPLWGTSEGTQEEGNTQRPSALLDFERTLW